MTLVGQKCPPIGGLQFIQGDAFDPLEHGGPSIIEFWASWCGPCRVIFPHLSKIAQQRAEQGLRVVGISLDQEVSQLRAFVKSQGSNLIYAVAMDPTGQAQQLMTRAGISGIPCAFVVDRDGVIRYHGHPADPKFEAAVKEVCSGPAQQPKEQQPLPLITQSKEELMGLSVKELKRILEERKVSYAGLMEKGELADRIVEACSKTMYYA